MNANPRPQRRTGAGRRAGLRAGGWLALAAAVAVGSASARAEGPATVRFGRDVLPILSEHCLLCHGPDAGTRKADLRLDLQDSALRGEAPVIVPGQPGESELIFRVRSADPDEVMPPPSLGRPLRPEQVEILTRWIEQGAEWGQHWAFEPPARPEPPEVRDAAWPRNPIDRFVLARLEAEGLTPSPEADRATLIRRLSLDLTGLPPTVAEVDAFLADEAPGAVDRLVDRLLASPHHGERMAADWLDAARYADTNGFQNDFARTMWPWRDWVVDAFNRNLPFDRFVVEQIAGDLLPGPTRDQRIATGFNRNNRTVTEGGSIEEEWRVENAVDRVETTATVFLGLTMGCARCHDHKYDPVSQEDFYKFFAFFTRINEKGVYNELRGNGPPVLAVPAPEDEARQADLIAAIARAEGDLKAREAGLALDQARWEQDQRQAPGPVEPRDWSFRAALDGSLHLEGRECEGLYRGEGEPAWTDGPLGRALRLDGKDSSLVEAGQAVGPERTDAFSYGGWVRRRGEGALLSKMDDAAGYRGFDLLVSKGKVEVHLVHAWPDNAIKVTTQQDLPKDAWTHVLVRYDGSSKAAGVAVFLDGKPAALTVQADTLSGTIATDQPLRIGRRSTAFALDGDLADLRSYLRALSDEEVRSLVDAVPLTIARLDGEVRTPAQDALLARSYRDRFATAFAAAQAELARLRKEKGEVDARIPTVMVMEDRPDPPPTYVLKRGRYDQPDTTRPVEPGVPATLPALPSDAPGNRLGLARWLVAPENPLTARVAVNRVWQQHFGTGLVKTVDNFGLQGERPSHPDLLDWLATEFVRSGWDLKALHRLIVTSATYRQASESDPDRLARDPENRLLGRGPRFRLPAETLRDNALAIAGLWNPKRGGPPIKPYQPEGLWAELAGGAGEGPYVQDKGADLYRRSLYIYRKRTVPHPALATFDAPSREICTVNRPRTDTPLQALALLNDVTYVEAARQLAQRMLTEGGASPEERVTFAFRRATARRPSAEELARLLGGLDRYRALFAADRAAAEAFVRVGESPVAEGLDLVELAACTATAGVILNLDETVTLE